MAALVAAVAEKATVAVDSRNSSRYNSSGSSGRNNSRGSRYNSSRSGSRDNNGDSSSSVRDRSRGKRDTSSSGGRDSSDNSHGRDCSSGTVATVVALYSAFSRAGLSHTSLKWSSSNRCSRVIFRSISFNLELAQIN